MLCFVTPPDDQGQNFQQQINISCVMRCVRVGGWAFTLLQFIYFMHFFAFFASAVIFLWWFSILRELWELWESSFTTKTESTCYEHEQATLDSPNREGKKQQFEFLTIGNENANCTNVWRKNILIQKRGNCESIIAKNNFFPWLLNLMKWQYYERVVNIQAIRSRCLDNTTKYV